MKKFLISGFEPFGPHLVNSSEVILKNFKNDPSIRTILLPVSFEDCFEKLKNEIEHFSPDAIILLGLAASRPIISLEKVAINYIDSEYSDNTGLVIKDSPINPQGQNAYFSTLPLKEMLEVSVFPTEITYTAGTFVCNCLFYQLMQYLGQLKIMAGFIHLPHLGEDELLISKSLHRMIEVIRNK